MKKLQHTSEFKALGYDLNRFNRADTGRFGLDGEEYKFYAAENGRMIAKFVDLSHAAEWLERKQILSR